MKRHEMVEKIANFLMDGYSKEHQTHDTGIFCLAQADTIVAMIQEAGMLPPINTCKIIPDGKGGFKHSETKREWDDEDTISKD